MSPSPSPLAKGSIHVTASARYSNVMRPISSSRTCGNTGGIMEVKKIAAMAEAYNMRIQPHVCASPVSTAAALHSMLASRTFMIQEIYPYRVPEHFQIVDHSPELEARGGNLLIPDRAVSDQLGRGSRAAISLGRFNTVRRACKPKVTTNFGRTEASEPLF